MQGRQRHYLDRLYPQGSPWRWECPIQLSGSSTIGLSLKQIEQEKEQQRLNKLEQEKRNKATAELRSSLKAQAGNATINKLLAISKIMDEDKSAQLDRLYAQLDLLPKSVVEYLLTIINLRKELLDSKKAEDLKQEDALNNLQQLINAYLGY